MNELRQEKNYGYKAPEQKYQGIANIQTNDNE